MQRVDEPVRIARGQSGWNNEDRGPAVTDEPVPDFHQFRGTRSLAPAFRNSRRAYRVTRYTLRHLRPHQHEILGRIVRIDVDEVFEYRQREMFSGIRKACSHT